MTLITDALDRIARQVSLDKPSTWLGATDDEYLEIRDDFLDETVGDILDRIDVPAPMGAQTTITGDGSGSYALPADFRRLQRDDFAVYETTTVRRRLYPISNDGMWTHLTTIGSTGGDRYYKIEGDTIYLYREPSSSISVVVSYVTNNWMKNAAGTAGSAFTTDTDELLMPRTLVETGVVWRWRERKGLPFAGKLAEYESKLARFSNDTRGRRSIDMAPSQSGRAPWDIPVPDFIPTS